MRIFYTGEASLFQFYLWPFNMAEKLQFLFNNIINSQYKFDHFRQKFKIFKNFAVLRGELFSRFYGKIRERDMRELKTSEKRE